MIEEFLNFIFHFDLNALTLVELLKKTKEPGKLISIIEFLIHGQESIWNLNKVTHYNRKHRHSKQQNHRCKCSLITIERMQISKAYRGQWRERKVCGGNDPLHVGLAHGSVHVLPNEIMELTFSIDSWAIGIVVEGIDWVEVVGYVTVDVVADS